MIKRLLPILMLIVVWLIFSKPFFIDGKIPFPSDYQVNHHSLWNSYENFWGPVKNSAMPDVIGQLMPWKHFTIESWKSLNVPLWNPYSFSGTPHLANFQSSAFSITNLFYFIFNFNDTWSLAVLIQPLLAGIFMYLFVRSLKLSQEAGLIASISFMFCGFIVVWMSWTTLSLAISFLPLALFSIEKYFNSKKIIFLFLLFLSIPLSFLSGHFQISLYFSIFVLAYIFFKLIETKEKKCFFDSLIFFVLGLFFSLPQILPSIELYLNAPRSLIFQKIEAVSLFHLPTIIAPDFYGNPVTRNDFLGHYIEWNGFFGVIPFLLAAYALFAKSKKVLFFGIACMASLILCLNTPIVDLLVNLKIPVLSTSALSRILGIFCFSAAVLSAFGLDLIRKDLENKRYKKFAIWLSIMLGIFIFLWTIVLLKIIDPSFQTVASRNLILPTALLFGFVFTLILAGIKKIFIPFFLLVLILLTGFDMLRFAIKWQPFESKELAFVQTPIISKLLSLEKVYRTLGPYGAEGSVYYKIPSIDGYDPLYIGRYGELISALYDGKITQPARLGVKFSADNKYSSKIFDFLGIKYILQKSSDIGKAWDFPFKKYPKNKFKLIHEDEQFLIYENRDVFPRAYLVGNYRIVTNDQEIISSILDDNLDLKKTAVIEKDPNIDQTKNLKAIAIIKTYEPNTVTIDAEANNPSLLLLTDNYYPGWKAKVNGKEAEILRANYTFRAVVVPKGTSSVEFYYDPNSFRWGLALSVLSVFGVGLILGGGILIQYGSAKI